MGDEMSATLRMNNIAETLTLFKFFYYLHSFFICSHANLEDLILNQPLVILHAESPAGHKKLRFRPLEPRY
jgi:hypothetical protein